MSAAETLFEQAVRGFLVERGVPLRLVDTWTDGIVAIANEHPPGDCEHHFERDEDERGAFVQCTSCGATP